MKMKKNLGVQLYSGWICILAVIAEQSKLDQMGKISDYKGILIGFGKIGNNFKKNIERVDVSLERIQYTKNRAKRKGLHIWMKEHDHRVKRRKKVKDRERISIVTINFLK